MSDQDLCNLFSGYGYSVRFVEDMEDIDAGNLIIVDTLIPRYVRFYGLGLSGN
jgi:hypothetical protein